ncbi:MAG TPA: GNAT family N-acetyltransferase [Chloroflexota bacterium]|nr:GNAT family N-acetyltransferase [Chloroflexota bacterium]
MPSHQVRFALPRDLGDGLVLRWATAHDTEALACFNLSIHSEDPEQPDTWLAHWTRDLMSGAHPTTGPGDFTVVVDQRQDGRIVSSMCWISQAWAYEDIPFAVGRPELVGTDPAYRRQGLVRAQFEAMHALSAARGEAVQAITGIPWYYRQFGYEMAVDLGGSRRQYWPRLVRLKDGEQERSTLREATLQDIPLLAQLYDIHRGAGMISCLRDEAAWRWLLNAGARTNYWPRYYLVEDPRGTPDGYLAAHPSPGGETMHIQEVAALPGHSLRAVCTFVGRALKARAEALNPARAKPITHLNWELGAAHPAYEALGSDLEQQEPPYAWYLRVADLPAFLRRIAPVLERRLAGSVLDGYSGTLRLSFYTSSLTLVFERGTLADIGGFTPKRLGDGDALFPDLTFLQLLFGHRDRAELRHARADCYTHDQDAAVLLDVLFPRRPSCPIPLA